NVTGVQTCALPIYGRGPPLLVPGDAHPDQLDARVDRPHEACVLGGVLGISLCAAVAHLPWPVHLVAHAPVPDPPRLLSAIAAAPAGHGRVPELVGVVHPATV